ncbi:hypothetical protein M426DRAFT_224691 [Hypoxylon sp. CI-4A]|nr:hypothetical protein M426DRAFT_224691 [Hypoxylon sp. CI-4A]
MSDKHVKFVSGSTRGSPRSHHSRELAHDSGVGSLSSEQASIGGRPDRRFTVEDFQSQLYDVGALQEALGQANKRVEYFQQKCLELDDELSKAHKIARDTDKLYRDECEHNQKLEQLNNQLKTDKLSKADKIKELQAAYDDLRVKCNDIEQKYYSLIDPVAESSVRAGSGDSSSSRLRRSGSKHDKDRKESRTVSRKQGEHRDERPPTTRQRRRSPSTSVKPGARSSSRKPYIEPMPRDKLRHSGNYTTALQNPSMETVVLSTPRSHAPPSSYHGVNNTQDTGNYIEYPLYETRGRRY